MTRHTGLTVHSRNANGLALKINVLRECINRHKPDIMLLQDTHMSGLDKYYFANYQFYHTPSRTIYKRRCTDILVKTKIPLYKIPNPSLSCIEATMIMAKLPNITPINFISVYTPPPKKIIINNIQCAKDIEALLCFNITSFMAGDFNAKNRAWNCVRAKAIGNQIYKFNRAANLYIHVPDTSTILIKEEPQPSTSLYSETYTISALLPHLMNYRVTTFRFDSG